MVDPKVRQTVIEELSVELSGNISEGALRAITEELGELSTLEIAILSQVSRAAIQATSIAALRKLAKRHPGHRDWLEPIDNSSYHTSASWLAAEVY